MSVIAYIALGSNLKAPHQQLENALSTLSSLANSTLMRVSAFYRSKAIGPGEQADYINAVCQLTTTLSPHGLLRALQEIENSQGRVRRERWGPRTLDLDILLYGKHCINTNDLHIPHPRMHERNFVIYPLHEIAPDLQLPDGLGLPKQVTLESLLAQLSETNLVRLHPDSER